MEVAKRRRGMRFFTAGRPRRSAKGVCKAKGGRLLLGKQEKRVGFEKHGLFHSSDVWCLDVFLFERFGLCVFLKGVGWVFGLLLYQCLIS